MGRGRDDLEQPAALHTAGHLHLLAWGLVQLPDCHLPRTRADQSSATATARREKRPVGVQPRKRPPADKVRLLQHGWHRCHRRPVRGAPRHAGGSKRATAETPASASASASTSTGWLVVGWLVGWLEQVGAGWSRQAGRRAALVRGVVRRRHHDEHTSILFAWLFWLAGFSELANRETPRNSLRAKGRCSFTAPLGQEECPPRLTESPAITQISGLQDLGRLGLRPDGALLPAT